VNIEFDLKEILVRIEGKVDKLSEDVNLIKVELATTRAELKGEITATKVELSGEIKTLEAKVDGLGKRVDTQEFINRGVIIGLLLAILGGFAKIFGFVS
jgi:outer membrane murein-binding lipoprotein Lpp